MAISFVLSNETINDRGFRIKTDGIKLDRFKANPIMLWMHRRDDGWDFSQVLPIGRWDNIRKEEGKLMADPVFDENDPFAKLIKQKVESGFLRGCSVGISPLKYSTDQKDLLPGQSKATVLESELYEASIVDIPSNKNTVRLFTAPGSPDENNVPLILNNMQTEKKPFTFDTEADLLAFVKEKFNVEPRAGEDPQPEMLKSETALKSWLKKVFNLTPKAKEDLPIENQASDDRDEQIQTLSTERDALTAQVEELRTQVQNLQAAPGAQDQRTSQDADASQDGKDDDMGLSVYASAKATYDAVVG